jgi:ATP-dependent DNA helicase RecG
MATYTPNQLHTVPLAELQPDPLSMIGKHQPVSREEINELLLDKLPEVLNENQKMDKIHNLVSSLSGKRIRNIGGRRTSKWVLVEQRPLVKLGRV